MAESAPASTPAPQAVPTQTQAPGGASASRPAPSAGGPPIIQQAAGGVAGTAPEQAPEVDPLEEALARKPVRVKAGGKEREIRSRADIEKYIQKGLPIAESLKELADTRSQLEPVAKALEALRGDDPAQALELLEGLMGPRFVRVAEARLMRELEREKATEGMTERERAMHQELERVKAERAQAAEQARRHEEAQRQAEEQRHVTALRQHIQGEVSGALESLGLPPTLEAHAMAWARPLVEASIRAGQPLDRESLATEVQQTIRDGVTWATRSLSGKALLDFFGAETKAKYRAALLEEVRGGGQAPRPVAGAPTQSTPKVIDFRDSRRW